MKKRNPTRAEREAMASFAALQKKWDEMPKFSRKVLRTTVSNDLPMLKTPPGRPTGREHKSVDTGFNGGTKPVHSVKYTGTKMIGVGVLHKSNAVPVFSNEEAVDMARMRRG